MDDPELFPKDVVLSNGARVRMERVISVLGLLKSLLTSGGHEDRALVFHLREACLGRGVVPQHLKSRLIHATLLAEDGAVPPLSAT